MSVRTRVLLGSEVTSPGALEVVDAGTVAAACSPGAVVTVEALRDPNEDAAVVATAPDGTWLAAVVDGNGTMAGTRAVVDHVVARAAGLLRARRPDVAGVLADAIEAMHEARRAGADATGASVTLVVGRGDRLWAWTRGDTAAVVAGGFGPRPLTGIVPPPLGPAPVPGVVASRRDPAEVVLLASDGLFAALGLDFVAALGPHGDASPAARARSLVSAALARGARDAVTVVVAGRATPPDTPGRPRPRRPGPPR